MKKKPRTNPKRSKRKRNPATLVLPPAAVHSFVGAMLGQIAGKIISDSLNAPRLVGTPPKLFDPKSALDDIRESTRFQPDEPSDPLREVAEEKLKQEEFNDEVSALLDREKLREKEK